MRNEKKCIFVFPYYKNLRFDTHFFQFVTTFPPTSVCVSNSRVEALLNCHCNLLNLVLDLDHAFATLVDLGFQRLAFHLKTVMTDILWDSSYWTRIRFLSSMDLNLWVENYGKQRMHFVIYPRTIFTLTMFQIYIFWFMSILVFRNQFLHISSFQNCGAWFPQALNRSLVTDTDSGLQKNTFTLI